MNPKTSDQFHSAIIAQYKDIIHEAVLECDHKLYLDSKKLDKQLALIVKAAVMDGLSESEVKLLIDEAKSNAPTHLNKAG